MSAMTDTTTDEPIAVPRSSLLNDTSLVFWRELRPVVRDPLSVGFGLIQPLFFLALFAPLLNTVTGLGTGDSLQWFVPGLIVMLCLFGTGSTGANLLFEMETGSHERMLVTPLSRSSLLIGRALKEILPVILQAMVVIVVALPFGFRANLGGAVLGLAMLSFFCIGLGALSYTLALYCKKTNWLFWVIQQTLLFPLLLLAGMLLPVDEGPGWLRALSAANPLTYIVNAERELFNGQFDWSTIGAAALASVIVVIVGLFVGSRKMQSSN